RLEVLDDAGVAFLRIASTGVEGNLSARAWYATYSPGAPIPAASALGGEPRWQRVRREPSFGWFDPRLDAPALEVPPRVIEARAAADVGRFRIPLRVDGDSVVLSGRFRWRPPPAGAYATRLESAAQLAPGVRVKLLPGRAPGLLVENTSAQPLTVL